MFNKIKSFIKPKKIKVKVKPPRKITTKNIGGGKKIVSSKPKPRRQTGGKRGPTKTEKVALGTAGAGAIGSITINKMLRDRRDARADDSKTSATPKRKPKKSLAQGTSEKGRGKVGTKRNVLKRGNKFGGSGVVRNQGKAVKTGKGTAAYKKMMEKRKNK